MNTVQLVGRLTGREQIFTSKTNENLKTLVGTLAVQNDKTGNPDYVPFRLPFDASKPGTKKYEAFGKGDLIAIEGYLQTYGDGDKFELQAVATKITRISIGQNNEKQEAYRQSFEANATPQQAAPQAHVQPLQGDPFAEAQNA